MQATDFKELVLSPALESISEQLVRCSERVGKYSKTAEQHLRVASGYVMLAHQEMRGEENA